MSFLGCSTAPSVGRTVVSLITMAHLFSIVVACRLNNLTQHALGQKHVRFPTLILGCRIKISKEITPAFAAGLESSRKPLRQHALVSCRSHALPAHMCYIIFQHDQPISCHLWLPYLSNNDLQVLLLENRVFLKRKNHDEFRF